MSLEAHNHAMASKHSGEGRHARKLLLAVIADVVRKHEGKKGDPDQHKCWYGNEALADRALMSARNVQYLLEELEFDGWIRIEYRNSRGELTEKTRIGRGGRRSIFYTFLDAAKGETAFTLNRRARKTDQAALSLVAVVETGLDPDRRQPVLGVEYELRNIGGVTLAVVPGSDTRFKFFDWYKERPQLGPAIKQLSQIEIAYDSIPDREFEAAQARAAADAFRRLVDEERVAKGAG